MKNKNNNKGFSLIELIFTVIFLTIIITGTTKLQISGVKLGNTSSNEIEALLLANQGVEVVKGLGKSSISAACSNAPCATCEIPNNALTCDGTPESIDGLFNRTIQIEDSEPSGGYTVTAVVEWVDSTGDHSATAKRIVF